MANKDFSGISLLNTETVEMDSVPVPIEQARPEQAGTRVSKKELLFVTGATLAALALRMFMLTFARLITSDGVWYALLGKNLISGDFEGGLSTYWPPLYPFLIGVTSLIVEDLELAGRLVSAVSGSLLVIPVYVLARRLYGKTEAGIAAFIIIICPALVFSSTLVLTESLYTLLFTVAVLAAVCGLTQEKRWLFLLAGAAFGACYLTKPEAIGFGVLLVVATLSKRLFSKNANVRTILASALLAFIGFAVLSLPYIFYLRGETGRWTISEKLTGTFGVPVVNNKWRGLIEGGQTTLADKLWAGGSSRAPTELVAESGSPGSASRSRFWIPRPKWIVRALYLQYTGLASITTPSLLVLAGLGFVGTRWSRKRARKEACILLFVTCTLLGYAFVGFVQPRYLAVLIPFVICWSARGVVALETCLTNIEMEVRQSKGFLIRHRTALRSVLLVCLAASVVPSLPRGAPAEKGNEKQIAFWIKQDSGTVPPLILAASPLMAFFSGGRHLYTPAEEYNVVMDYARRKNVDYLVIEERSIGLNAELRFLLDDTQDHPGLELVHRDDARGRKVLVFKLTEPREAREPSAELTRAPQPASIVANDARERGF